MLTAYRRHVKKCAHRSEGRQYRRCQCPIWVDGILGGEEIRESVKTRDWERAQGIIREWESQDKRVVESEPMTIAGAFKDCLADAVARGVRQGSLGAYKRLSRKMQEFAQSKGLSFMREFDLPTLREFRAWWPIRDLGFLKAFFNFALDSEWIDKNPARKIKKPKDRRPPTMPFTPQQMADILAASERYGNGGGGLYRDARLIRALILLLRYSGLRIGDATTLERGRITGDKLFLYTSKAGTPVHVLLPPWVVDALAVMPKLSERYFFWTGGPKAESIIRQWESILKGVFREAGIPDGHAHQFRDTFAVELLKAGVPMDRVSVLLGHSGIQVTERHYAPWVKERQELLEADVRRAWEPSVAA